MVNLEAIRGAAERIGPVLRPTPLIQSHALTRRCGVPVWYKPENLQRGGSFKVRGAYHRISHLDPEERAAGASLANRCRCSFC